MRKVYLAFGMEKRENMEGDRELGVLAVHESGTMKPSIHSLKFNSYNWDEL